MICVGVLDIVDLSREGICTILGPCKALKDLGLLVLWGKTVTKLAGNSA